MKTRLYFDTSVFGGIFDEEFQEATTLLFEQVKRGNIVCVYSDLTVAELEPAPENVRQFFTQLPQENMEFVEITQEVVDLAQKYLNEKVVGETSVDDCKHIATATINKVDYLVSWNFRHVVNVFRIRGYNAVNLVSGYGLLDIRSPKEIVYGTNDK